ncbi:MAG: hypothetical protein LBU27_08920 [Candidatus Peribacteria bacterium]|nr:hypothetical protein [Candidatus Peribacteria bacterium]
MEKALRAVKYKHNMLESPIGTVNEAILLDYTRKGNLTLNAHLRQGNLTKEDKFSLGVMDKLFANLPKEE